MAKITLAQQGASVIFAELSLNLGPGGDMREGDMPIAMPTARHITTAGHDISMHIYIFLSSSENFSL